MEGKFEVYFQQFVEFIEGQKQGHQHYFADITNWSKIMSVTQATFAQNRMKEQKGDSLREMKYGTQKVWMLWCNQETVSYKYTL